TRLPTVTGGRQRTSVGYCHHELPPLDGEITTRNHRLPIGFLPAVPPSNVRSPPHHHRLIRLDSNFHFQPLSASNSAPVRS
ncbi:hypothetical protein PanWU01x14_108290, partial [Parasponia andersonii]